MGLSGLFLLAGLGLLVFGVLFLQQAGETRSWPSTIGEVQNVRVRWSSDSKNNRTYYYSVYYAYQANDRAYEGNRYALGSGTTASKRYSTEAEARVAARLDYPIGSEVEVYYNPADPTSAVLEPGADWGTYVPLTLGLCFSPIGIVALYAIHRNYKRQS
jgi:hypothetical protein